MNYSETLEYLFSQLPMFQRSGAAAYKANLDNTYKICEILGNPHLRIKSIHIAGTNGKGSTAHMLASVLQQAGYRTGLFTSPHLSDFRERIKINGQPITKEAVMDFVHYGLSAFQDIQPSFFEYTFGMAMDYFASEKIDIAVIETGMGGRLDSTNVLQPLMSAITNIGMDHMQFLGNDLKQIAQEKAGIIKTDIPIVIGETQEEIREVFLEKATTLKSPIYFADQLFSARWAMSEKDNFHEHEVEILKNDNVIQKFPFSLLGNYQLKNLACIFQVLEIIRKQGFIISDKDCRLGLEHVKENTGFRGRWQILSEKPLIISDTAHNEAGIKIVMQQLATLPKIKLHMVFGMVNDKAIENILTLLPTDAVYYFCRPNVPRGLDENTLKQAAHKQGLQGESYPSIEQALKAAKLKASEQDIIFIGGSTFVVAEVV